MTLEFQYPHILWLLLIIPLLAYLHRKYALAAALRFSCVDIVKKSRPGKHSKAGRFLMLLRLIAIAFLIFALARPQLMKGETVEDASGIDIFLALDISSSMLALDFSTRDQLITRIEVAKKVIEDFIHKRRNDRLGLIAFAGDSYLVSPLTINHDWIIANLERIRVGLVQDGTAIGSAIAMGANRLKDLESKSRVIILLTDGVNNSGQISPTMAAEAASALNIKIYTIAAGVGGVVPSFIINRDGNIALNIFGKPEIIKADIPVDEETLYEIAQITKGKSYKASNLEELEKIYNEIDQLEKTDLKIKRFAQYEEYFVIPLLIALCFIGVEKFLAHTRFRRIP